MNEESRGVDTKDCAVVQAVPENTNTPSNCVTNSNVPIEIQEVAISPGASSKELDLAQALGPTNQTGSSSACIVPQSDQTIAPVNDSNPVQTQSAEQAPAQQDAGATEIINQSNQSVKSIIRELNFPRGMVGAPYKFEIALKEKLTGIKVKDIKVELKSDSLGLCVELQEDYSLLSLSGTPEKSGEIQIVLAYFVDSVLCEPKQMICEFKPIQITADPKTLWKNLPTDPNAPYQSPNSVNECVTGKDKIIIAASKQGRSHAHEGKFRDDNYTIHHIAEGDWYLVAVADGAGSAEFSREGSRIACSTFVSFMTERINESDGINEKSTTSSIQELEAILMNTVLKACYQGMTAIYAEAQNTNNPAKKYNTTLLAFVAKKIASEWLIVSFGVGDGAIGLLDNNDELYMLSIPDGGEYVGQTRFLTMQEIWKDNPAARIVKLRINDFKAILSMSDGVSDPKFETDNNLKNRDIWLALWQELNHEVQLAERSEISSNQLEKWLDFWSKGNHDDRTIAILY